MNPVPTKLSGKEFRFTADDARELLNYDRDTGIFTWRLQKGSRATQGMVAGALNKGGYIQIQVNGTLFLAHRLAWLMEHGEWPSGLMDHVNNIRTDNRIENLRVANRYQNCHNQKLRSDSSTGIKGVSLTTNGKRWRATVQSDGKQIFIGSFESKVDAANAAKAARENLHGEFARHS